MLDDLVKLVFEATDQKNDERSSDAVTRRERIASLRGKREGELHYYITS